MKGSIFLEIGIVLATMSLFTGCAGNGLEKPEPYDYTHTTELKKFEIYETERLRGAERSVLTTMEQLGYGDLTIAGGEEAEILIEFTLPDDAAQGPDIWYTINFHFVIEFADDTGSGFCDVTAGVNDSAAAMVNFETMIVDESPYIRILGQPSSSTRNEIRYYNYLSNKAVSPGKNVMRFKLKEFQGTKVKSVRVLGDTAIESTSVPPEAQGTGPSPEPQGLEPFYGVSPELTARLEQICLADPRVQELVKDRVYSFVVDGQTVEDKDYNLAVGVRLKKDITSQEFKEWMDSGRQDSSIIREYVGVLNIGYNEKYHLVIDFEKGELSELTREEKSSPGIPEVTAEEKQRAIKIALADTTVRQILEGKKYEVAPNGEIGVWHSGNTKLGVAFEIRFDRPYQIDAELPRYQSGTYHYSGEAERLNVNVLLAENRVASIVPISPPPSMR